ncbi:MAG: hypothetical protein CXZ00_00065 [Acidobacteria bacterium]|nr:MAG: hypothetical protein CXZ00_00065 [Acidobacteriota bacterium]
MIIAGLTPEPQHESSAVPPPMDVNTRLAFDRTRAAYDNTLMSWIRTATSLISFGFTIYKFFQIELDRVAQVKRLIGPREFALFMVGIGMLSMLMGTFEYWQNMRGLRARCPDLPRSRTGYIGLLISVLGVLALAVMILRQ